MSPAEFWDGDPDLAVQYRKAHDLKRERASFDAWLQGRYIYEALLSVAPVFRFGMKVPKPQPYMEEPIPITKASIQKEQEDKDKKVMEKGLARMNGLFARMNTKLTGGKDNA